MGLADLPLLPEQDVVIPSQKKRPVTLTVADREELARITTTGVHAASMIRRARVLLALDTSVGAVDPEEAFALAQRLEIHHTPKHGSWLNIAEIELSALTHQCLDRRISDLDVLDTELAAWQAATNAAQRQVDWQFTTEDVRVKLRHLYPNQ